jgi:DNA helicase-2/ATP-dependent DNA helicase PcrA
VEEERRLLYVACTRARDDLHLLAPLRFYVTQQHRWGDRHVYGARSRFVTESVRKTFESRAWPAASDQSAGLEATRDVRIDASAHMLDMWGD